MKTIEARIPEPVLKQAEEVAEREHIPLDQVITLAVTQGLGTWSNDSHIQSDLALHAKRADRERFLAALTDALNGEPRPSGLPLPGWYG